MKSDYLSINEVAKLYGISTHTIRYYEKIGLISPQRMENNYRIFSYNDLYRLNIIRDFLELGISIEKIREYLDYRVLSETEEILRQNLRELDNKIFDLKRKSSGVKKRLELLDRLKFIEVNKIIIQEYGNRYAFFRDIVFSTEEQFEKASRQLYGEVLDIHDFNDIHMVGAIINDIDRVDFKGVLLLSQKALQSKINYFTFPAGKYISLFYQGSYTQNKLAIKELENFIKLNGYNVDLPYYEFYLIDFHSTYNIDEFITEIQVKVKDS